MKPDSHMFGLQREPGIDVLEAARRACFEYVDPTDSKCKGVPAVAKKIAMSPGVLYNKLNYASEGLGHALTVPDLVQIIGVTGDMRIVAALCHTFGVVCFPVPDMSQVSDAALLDLLNNIGAQGGDFHRAFSDALKGKRCTAKAVAIVHREGYEYMGAIAETMARMPGLIDGK